MKKLCCNFLFLFKLRFKWAKLQVHSYCSSKDMRGQSFALSQWKIAKISKPYGIQRVNMGQILNKKFEKCPNFAKYLIFDPKTGKKTQFWEIWNFSHLCINPLWTIGHICHTIFGPRRMCGYLRIAPERLKIWKKVLQLFVSLEIVLRMSQTTGP